MARKPRVHYEGAIYHVIARGNNRENVFLEAEDKAKYLNLLAKYKDKFGCDLLEYVLMDNHFHFLIRINQDPLSVIMQGLQQSYTQYFNRKYQHVGHVFQQRYKAFICNDDAYLITLICYIHQNPCRANMSDGLAYTWSSHSDYLRGYGSMVNPGLVLQLFSDDTRTAIKLYGETVAQVQELPVLTVQSIEENNAQKHMPMDGEKELPKEVLPVGTGMTLEKLIEQVLEKTGVSREQLLGHCRVRHVAAARNLLIYRAVKEGICIRMELAKQLQLDPARITRAYQEAEVIDS